MKQIYLLFLTLFILLGCVKNESEFERILKFEDQRVSCDSLLIFLNNNEPTVRTRAVEAIGKLQDQSCTDAIGKMLNDLNHNVRLQAAFAVGQLGKSELEPALIKRLDTNERSDVKVRILEALGKIGTNTSFKVLMKYIETDDEALRAAAALSAGRMAFRDLFEQELTDSLSQLLNDRNDEVRWKAAYALMRISRDLPSEPLRKSINDDDARVRMFAIEALGKNKDISAVEDIGRKLGKDPDWRVRVKAASALGQHPLSLVANYFSFLEQIPHVRMAIIQAIGASGKLYSDQFRDNSREINYSKHLLEQVCANDHRLHTNAEIGAALISLAHLLGENAIEPISKFIDHPEERLRARAMTALGETGSAEAATMLERHYANAPTSVKIAILNALSKLEPFARPNTFQKALEENDHVLVALAAQGLSGDSLGSEIDPEPIIEAYKRLPKPVDTESAQMIFDAFGKLKAETAIPVLQEALKSDDQAFAKAAAKALHEITGEDYSNQITAFTKPNWDIDYKKIAMLKGNKAYIQTERGTIEIELFADEAPLTVHNFVRLADDGFYDKLRFHRVVPNFVIQGGDPRGDSWGSPGYAIRSEFNTRPYLRGTVGMASSGKDTEGCQFFITHSPQPHLDGRYTVFGKVTSGMDVVDAIQEDDMIKLIAIKK